MVIAYTGDMVEDCKDSYNDVIKKAFFIIFLLVFFGEPVITFGQGQLADVTAGCFSDTGCYDANQCTTDKCVDYQCSFTVIEGCCQSGEDCNDDDPCTQDNCGSNFKCTHIPITGCCRGVTDCGDNDPCTDDACNSNHQCVNEILSTIGTKCGECGKYVCTKTAGLRCEEGFKNECGVCDGPPLPGKGKECREGVGACENVGQYICSSDGLSLVCSVGKGTPGAELCGDKIDNDCNGKTDEGFDVGATCEVGIGECKVVGQKICSGDKLTTVCNAVPRDKEYEICDGKDNDCNGYIDEVFWCCKPGMVKTCYDGPEETAGVGACHAGSQVCGNDYVFPTHCESEVVPVDETCDGLDNDCDGVADEGVGDVACTTECGMGVMKCEGGRFECRGPVKNACGVCGEDVPAEICDGLDNNCDGKIDEGFEQVGQTCAVGEGFCRAEGKYVCSGDKTMVVCDAKLLDLRALGIGESACAVGVKSVSRIFDAENPYVIPLPMTRIDKVRPMFGGSQLMMFGQDDNGRPVLGSVDVAALGRGEGVKVDVNVISDNQLKVVDMMDVNLTPSTSIVLVRGDKDVYISTPKEGVADIKKLNIGEGVGKIYDWAHKDIGGNDTVVMAVSLQPLLPKPPMQEGGIDVQGEAGQVVVDAGGEQAALGEAGNLVNENAVVEGPQKGEFNYGIVVLKMMAEDLANPEVSVHEMAWFGERVTIDVVDPGEVVVFTKPRGETILYKCALAPEWNCQVYGLVGDVPITSYHGIMGADLPPPDISVNLLSGGVGLASVAKPGWKRAVEKEVVDMWVDKDVKVIVPGAREQMVADAIGAAPIIVKSAEKLGDNFNELVSSKVGIAMFEPFQGDVGEDVAVVNIEFVDDKNQAIRTIRVTDEVNVLPADEEMLIGSSVKAGIKNCDEYVVVNPQYLTAVDLGKGGGDGLAVVYTKLSRDGTSEPLLFIYDNINEKPDVVIKQDVYNGRKVFVAIAVDPAADAVTYEWALKDADGVDHSDLIVYISEQIVELNVEHEVSNAMGIMIPEAWAAASDISWPLTLTATVKDPGGLEGSDQISINSKGVATKLEAVPPSAPMIPGVPGAPELPVAPSGIWEIMGGCSLVQGNVNKWHMLVVLGFTSIIWWTMRWWILNRARCRVKAKKDRHSHGQKRDSCEG